MYTFLTHTITPRPIVAQLGALLALLVALPLVGCDDEQFRERTTSHARSALVPADAPEAPAQPFAVSGSGVHYFSTAIVHSKEPTDNGMIQRSTDIIELSGDLTGYVLYHPTSVFDYENQTLVNTGKQVFSGTIGDSAPVILHDDTYRFEADLDTGAMTGVARLNQSVDTPDSGTWFECTLEIVGTGVTPEGDNLSDYSGECTLRGSAG